MIFSKIKNAFENKISNIFSSKKKLDEILEELEEMLILSDIGVKTSTKLIKTVREKVSKEKEENLKEAIIKNLKIEMTNILNNSLEEETFEKKVILIVGVNGVGKTTSIAKLANYYKQRNKKVILAAADTFRAGAIEQLDIWAEVAGVKCIKASENADPSSVIYEAVKEFKKEEYNLLICDSAGRLHNKKNLMDEIEKMKRTILKNVSEDTLVEVLLVIDAMSGQNGVEQAKSFFDKTNVDGIILTKLDSTAKGGVVFSIIDEIKIPIKYIGIGEKIDDMKLFNSKEFVDGIL